MKTQAQAIEELVTNHESNMYELKAMRDSVIEVMARTRESFDVLTKQLLVFEESILNDYDALNKRLVEQISKLGSMDEDVPETKTLEFRDIRDVN